jgi:hypothetical protein
MAQTNNIRTLHGRRIVVLSAHRWIAGGAVVTVTWEQDDETQMLPDGTVHPAHRRGFTWDEPVSNLSA